MQEKGKIQYRDAFGHYVFELLEALKEWSENQLDKISDNPDFPNAKCLLQHLPDRITFALESGIFNTAELGLQLPTMTPIICASFVLDVGTYLQTLRTPLMEVLRMIEPMFCGVMVDSTTQHEFKDRPTEMLKEWITKHRPQRKPQVILHHVSDCFPFSFG